MIDDETEGQKFLPPTNGSGNLLIKEESTNPKKPNIYPMPNVKDVVPLLPPSPVEGTRGESENKPEPTDRKGDLEKVPPNRVRDHITSRKPSEAKELLEVPVLLSRDQIAQIEDELIGVYNPNEKSTRIFVSLPDCRPVLVKKFNGACNGILEAEMKAAMSMCHRNIQGLIAYHKSEDSTFLVYPNTKRGTLEKYLLGEFMAFLSLRSLLNSETIFI